MTTTLNFIVRMIRDDSEIISYESLPKTEVEASMEAARIIDALADEKHPGATVQVIDIEHGHVLDEHYTSNGYVTANFPI